MNLFHHRAGRPGPAPLGAPDPAGIGPRPEAHPVAGRPPEPRKYGPRRQPAFALAAAIASAALLASLSTGPVAAWAQEKADARPAPAANKPLYKRPDKAKKTAVGTVQSTSDDFYERRRRWNEDKEAQERDRRRGLPDFEDLPPSGQAEPPATRPE